MSAEPEINAVSCVNLQEDADAVAPRAASEEKFDKRLRTTEPSDEILLEAFTDAEIEEMKKGLVHQERQPMTSYWLKKLERDAVKYWNMFYKHNANKFFKDRHYLHREIPDIARLSEERKKYNLPPPCLLEVGSGVGNAIFPLIEDVPYLTVKTMDCSKHAVEEVLKKSPQYSPDWCEAHVCDIAAEEFPFPEESAEFATLIFVLSALTPETMPGVFSKIYKTLKPGGMLYLRDYAHYDMAMLRFGPGAKISERFYKRGDGTRVYFAERSEMIKMAEDAGFVSITAEYRRRVVENRKEGLEMKRTWIQLKCYKPPHGECEAPSKNVATEEDTPAEE